jgi:folate-dependent phosphoribosylglycinamide formyltransferase PurN
MKTVILTGNQGNQRALCHRMARVSEVAAIVVSDNVPRRPPSLGKKLQSLANRLAGRLAGREFVETWFKMLQAYDAEYPEFPDVPIIRVKNVNDAGTLAALAKYAPDLTIVSGTNLVGKKVIAASKKIVNLHTGISPYVKGGPNCTNWCLAKNWFHLIGNTVMWLDLGIDTGRLIATEQTPLDGGETLLELHRKVMDHAHDLYTRAVRRIGEGGEVPSVPQSEIAEGVTFYTKDWNMTEQRAALRNFRDDYKNYFADPRIHRKMSSEIELVSLRSEN